MTMFRSLRSSYLQVDSIPVSTTLYIVDENHRIGVPVNLAETTISCLHFLLVLVRN